MEENDENDSVYKLMTKLCEKIICNDKKTASKNSITKLRSIAFEILLKKRVPPTDCIICLENNTDPYCQIIAWQFMLSKGYNLSEHANKIGKCVGTLEKLMVLNKSTLDGMITFLLELKKIPNENDRIMDYISRKNGTIFRCFDENQFKLPQICMCEKSRFNTNSFLKQPKRALKKFIEPLRAYGSSISFIDCCSSLSCYYRIQQKPPEIETKPNTNSILSSEEIWNIVSTAEYTDRRTWETIGDPTPIKEAPILSEAPPDLYSLLNELQSTCNYSLGRESYVPIKYITLNSFIIDVKNILVGIVSNTFNLNKENQIILMPEVAIKGFSNATLQSYCTDIIFCGVCYKALSNMSTMDPYSGKFKQDGYIFAELCESINRYLSFYRIAAQLPSASFGLIELHNHMRKLYAPLHALAAICKVGPFAESEQMPHGVALLNYLYEQALTFSNKDIFMVLYSVLYPCLQVYFCRFLRQWILEGSVSDPYNEFFIMSNHKYLTTRGRTYWTRGYTVNEDIVPVFLDNLRTEIFNCGRTMNLLKLCFPKSPICVYFMGKKPNILQCCLTSEQLMKLEENVSCYYLEAIAESGPRFSLENIIKRRKDQQQIFVNLVANKREITLKRIKLEKLKKMEEIAEKRKAEMKIVRDNYELGIKQKVQVRAAEIEEEMKLNESQFKMKMLEEKIIQEEAADMIKYYSKLFKETDKRKIAIEKHIDKMKKIYIDTDHVNTTISSVSSNSDVTDPLPTEINEICESPQDIVPTHIPNKLTIENLNALNANLNENQVAPNENMIYKQFAENVATARRNREKVLNVELGIELKPIDNINTIPRPAINVELSEAQRNKMRVMSTEYNIEMPKNECIRRPLSDVEINRNKNMSTTNKVFFGEYNVYDDINYINKNSYGDFINLDTEKDYINDNYIVDTSDLLRINTATKKTDHLSLDFGKIPKYNSIKRSMSSFTNFLKSPNFEFQKPMSVDSTPLTEFSPLPKLFSSSDRFFYNTPSTAATNFTDEGFNFKEDVAYNHCNIDTTISKRLTSQEAKTVSINCLNYFVQQSIIMPVLTQINLMQSEILKYFINDLSYLQHLNSLRNYFFLLDGEFGRNITEGLFDKLYVANVPEDLINCRTLKHLVFSAVDSSCKISENSCCLSFKVNKMPKIFDLGDPAVLDCLSLSYEVAWPLNILLPSDTIGKYDEVFKFLLRLHRVSWVLKKIFMELKMLAKLAGKREAFLMLSPQYQKLHLSRHVMTHFIQTLQNYVVGEVLQTSWVNFEENLEAVKNIDQLYNLHTTYIKNILFMCLLNQRSAPIRKVINSIFVVVLKFYDYLRSRPWQFEDDVYIHPNYHKLDGIFNNFLEFVQFLFKAGHKVAKTGCQPQLLQLVDMLDINEFFSKRMKRTSSESSY